MCNQNIFIAKIEDMHSLWQGIFDCSGQHFLKLNQLHGRMIFCYCAFNHHSVVIWKPNTKTFLCSYIKPTIKLPFQH